MENDLYLELFKGHKRIAIHHFKEDEYILSIKMPDNTKKSLINAVRLLRGTAYIKAAYFNKGLKKALH